MQRLLSESIAMRREAAFGIDPVAAMLKDNQMRHRERRLDDGQAKILPRSRSLSEVRHLKRRSESTRARAIGAMATGAAAIGTLAIGAAAIGALAIGALVIGRLAIGHIRIRRVVVDDLVVRRLRITETMHAPDEHEAEKSASARLPRAGELER